MRNVSVRRYEDKCIAMRFLSSDINYCLDLVLCSLHSSDPETLVSICLLIYYLGLM